MRKKNHPLNWVLRVRRIKWPLRDNLIPSVRKGFWTAVVFFIALFLYGPHVPAPVYAEIDGRKIEKLKPKVFCINAGIDAAWEAALEVLKKNEIGKTLEDSANHVITTAFVHAETSRLRQLAKNAKLFSNGRFTLKIALTEMTPSYTQASLTLQIRQNKWIGKDERLLKSRGVFEKFLAYQINQAAIAKQFPEVYELRIGFDLVPDIENNQYRIKNVEERSAAGEAGFQDGDWLMAIDEEPMTIEGELFKVLLSGGSEKLRRFTVLRDDEELMIPLWVVRVPETVEKAGMSLSWDGEARHFWVSEVTPGSKAEKAGIKTRDIIVKEGDLPLNSWTNYYRALARVKPHMPVSMEIDRDGQMLVRSL